jgi:hypothetical protein
VSGVRRQLSTRQLVRDALRELRHTYPAHYAAVRDHVSRAPARVAVARERFIVAARPPHIVVADVHAHIEAQVDAHCSPLGLVQLVDGTATFETLMLRHEFDVRGHPDALMALYAATRVFAEAAVSSVALQQQFEEYRSLVARGV